MAHPFGRLRRGTHSGRFPSRRLFAGECFRLGHRQVCRLHSLAGAVEAVVARFVFADHADVGLCWHFHRESPINTVHQQTTLNLRRASRAPLPSWYTARDSCFLFRSCADASRRRVATGRSCRPSREVSPATCLPALARSSARSNLPSDRPRKRRSSRKSHRHHGATDGLSLRERRSQASLPCDWCLGARPKFHREPAVQTRRAMLHSPRSTLRNPSDLPF